MKNPLLIALLLCSVRALVLAAFKLFNMQWFPAVYLVVIGFSAILMVAAFVRSSNRPNVALEAADSAASGRIVMRGADPDGMLISAICFFVFSVALVLYADLLWTRWLSYCPAPVALGVVGVLLWETLGNETRACRGGLQRCPGAQCASPRTHHRGRLAGRRRRQEEDSQGWGVTHQPGIGTTRHELVLLDRKDEELLNVDDPLEPPDRYQRFLESIPRWTGLQVQETLDTK